MVDDEVLRLFRSLWPGEKDERPSFSVGSMKRQAGKFMPDRNEIRLSRYLLENHPGSVRDVLLHEIGHAIAYHRYGTNIRQHGEEWQEVMAELGVDDPDPTHSMTLVEPRYVLTCNNEDCDVRIERHRKSKVVKDPGRYRCQCGSRLRRES